jgi:hypothetical protein
MGGMADNEQGTAGTPTAAGAGGISETTRARGDGGTHASDIPRAPAGPQDPPADPDEPMNPA